MRILRNIVITVCLVACTTSAAQQLDKKRVHVFNQLSNNQDFGLVTDLIGQSGNGSSNIKIRVAYSGVNTGNYYKGTYNTASTYNAGERVSFSSSGYQWYTASQAVGTGNPPSAFGDNAYWDIESGVEMIQDMGDGTWMRYTLGFNQDDFIRWGTIQRGTLSTSSFTIKGDNFNTGTAIGASASSVTLAAAPSSYSFTLPTGLSNVYNKISKGSSSSSMTILGAGASPNFVNVTLSSGQSLEAGDKLKLENSASNFNIGVVIDYDNGTGATHLAIINGVGSGTFTSWTIYKVALTFCDWDSFPSTVYIHALVDTYDSGTGAATITSYLVSGTGTRATWTFREGRSAPVIPASAATEVGNTGTPLGSFVIGTYKGTKLIHRADIRNDGTAWRYFILQGDNLGDEYDITTYNSTFVADQQLTVASNLDYGGETGFKFIAFAISDGSSTNTRALLRHSTNTVNPLSYYHQADIDVFTATVPLAGGGDSSGELAWNFRLDGTSDDNYWLPDHNFDRVSFGRDDRVYTIDGQVLDHTVIGDYSYKFQSFTSFRLTQDLEVFHPDVVPKMADMTVLHELNNNGLHYKVTINTLQDWELSTGYVSMLAFPKAAGPLYWFNTMDTDLGGNFTDDGGTGTIALSGNQINWASALFKSTQASYTDNELFALAIWRSTPTQAATEAFGYSAGRKLYPNLGPIVIPSGSAFVIEDRIYAGNVGDL